MTTGVRVAALVSLRKKRVELVEKSVTQNPREVATKFGKHIDTFFAQGFRVPRAARRGPAEGIHVKEE